MVHCSATLCPKVPTAAKNNIITRILTLQASVCPECICLSSVRGVQVRSRDNSAPWLTLAQNTWEDHVLAVSARVPLSTWPGAVLHGWWVATCWHHRRSSAAQINIDCGSQSAGHNRKTIVDRAFFWSLWCKTGTVYRFCCPSSSGVSGLNCSVDHLMPADYVYLYTMWFKQLTTNAFVPFIYNNNNN